MAIASNLGFPRIGLHRELKRAVEAYWKGTSDEAHLRESAAAIRREHWRLQQSAGIDHIPSNDFSLYDHVLDTCCMVGAIPDRFNWTGGAVDLETYFAMARGVGHESDSKTVAALEMTKWFDTNYHYLVPELEPDQRFVQASTKPIDAYTEARELGIETRPVLLGPVSFLLLSKPASGHKDHDTLALLDRLLPVYKDILAQLKDAGAKWVQIDEPVLVWDLEARHHQALQSAYAQLAEGSCPSLLLTTYFGELADNLNLALSLPVAGLHIDALRGRSTVDEALTRWPDGHVLSLGLIDGRNIWKTNLSEALELAETAAARVGNDHLMIGPSCSLLHSPVDLQAETQLPDDLRQWLAFAAQKVEEVSILTRALNEGRDAVDDILQANQQAVESRKASTSIHRQEIKQKLDRVTDDMLNRQSPFNQRKALQQDVLALPVLPTTTIGSFPQTKEIRKQRAAYRRGEVDAEQYEESMKHAIREVIQCQEKIGLDVLVHGEPERTDMVEYFGNLLDGIAATSNGWVQSYGSRCVKPAIIFGDIHRPEPMTVAWSRYAQSLTDRPVKGMLTGPVTILQWCFVRDDQPRELTCKQLGLAIRDEVADLEQAGINVIQIDEPALREGLPLRRSDRAAYLNWAVDAFRLASTGVDDTTQIHTHMCYSEFNEIMDAIAALDADVISIEASRSGMELLDAFEQSEYPNDIGPGCYDIHSPSIPSVEELQALLVKALDVLRVEQLWVNPDCGLKTRDWPEVIAALSNMVEAAQNLRAQVTTTSQ